MIKFDIKQPLAKVKDYVKSGIWQLNIKEKTPLKRFLTHALRTVLLAHRGFKEDKLNLRASSLTFFSILSVVPVLAIIFGIAKGFGFDGKMQEVLRDNLRGQEDVAEWLIDFSSNMLNNVQGGLVLGIGLVFLFWSVIKVLGNIENSFNGIWHVKRSRVLFRKFSDYFSMMLVTLILLLMSSSVQVFLINMVDTITHEISFIGYVGPFLYFLVKMIPYALIWLLFTIVYMVMPNTKVNFWSALIAGIVAGTAFQLLQWGYFHFQIGVSRYNAIYGSFAALPLFLVWLNFSWLIVLFGAEISFSVQNHSEYEHEGTLKTISDRSRNIIAVLLAQAIVKQFDSSLPALTAPKLSAKLKLPLKIVRSILYDLIECEVIAETPSKSSKETAFLPARTIQGLKVLTIVMELNKYGNDFDFNDSELAQQVLTIFKQGDKVLEDEAINKALKDI